MTKSDRRKNSMATPRRILVADGNDANVQRYKDCLSNVNCDIQTAIDGAATLDCVRRSHPHLILLDPMLADINGFEVCKRIKGNPSTRRTMILMVIALNAFGDVQRAVDSGTDDVLTKPVAKTELLKRVALLLELQELSF